MSGDTGHAVIVDDSIAARRELRADGQYGGYANAEELIRGHFASVSPEVRAALRKKVNTEAYKQAKEDGVGDDIKVPSGGKLVDWTIRGDLPENQVISFVWADELGVWHRGVQGLDPDAYTAPEESENDRLVREGALADRDVRGAAIAGQVDIEARVAEMRAELSAEHEQKLASMRQEFEDRFASLSKGDADSGATASEPTGDADSGSGGDGEVKWPHNHDDMNALAKKGGLKKADLPDTWDDMTLPDKQAFLETKNVKPEAEG